MTVMQPEPIWIVYDGVIEKRVSYHRSQAEANHVAQRLTVDFGRPFTVSNEKTMPAMTGKVSQVIERPPYSSGTPRWGITLWDGRAYFTDDSSVGYSVNPDMVGKHFKFRMLGTRIFDIEPVGMAAGLE